MKNNLNEKIELLFCRMIRSWDRISNIAGGKITFDNGLSIYACKKSSKEKVEDNIPMTLDGSTFSVRNFFGYWDVVLPDTDKLIFYISTPYRNYTVPEFTDRHEYADVLDTIDDSIRKFEEKKLAEYCKHFENEK